MAAPRPGKSVRGSRSGRPIMAALDLLGRRWALRVVWELRGGPHTFRALQAACDGVSPTVLNSRVAELREVGVLEKGEGGYALTRSGEELLRSLEPLQTWSKRWSRDLGGEA